MDIFAQATATPKRIGSGPTQYKPLRDSLTDSDGSRYQLVARSTDAEPYALYVKGTAADVPAGPLVDVINARNVEAHALNTERADAKEAFDSIDAPTAEQTDAFDAFTAGIAAALKALPKIDATRCAPITRMLVMYSAEDDAA